MFVDIITQTYNAAMSLRHTRLVRASLNLINILYCYRTTKVFDQIMCVNYSRE